MEPNALAKTCAERKLAQHLERRDIPPEAAIVSVQGRPSPLTSDSLQIYFYSSRVFSVCYSFVAALQPVASAPRL